MIRGWPLVAFAFVSSLLACGTTLSEEGERVRIADEQTVGQPRCRYLGDVTGTATWLEGARNDARNQAADLHGNDILFVKETPETPPSGLPGDLGIKATASGRVYKCAKAKSRRAAPEPAPANEGDGK